MVGRNKNNALIQEIAGNNNTQVGGNLTKIYQIIPKSNVIRFYEKDIEEVILAFSENNGSSVNIIDDFFRPNIEEKNKINKLTTEYFEFMNDEYLPYFHKIDKFLMAIQNSKLQECYRKTTVEIRMKIRSCRSEFESFEEVFSILLDHVIEKGNVVLTDKRELMIIFLHYMYWNCDIGDKYVEA